MTPSVSKQDRKDVVPSAPVVRSFNSRLDLHEDKEKNIVTATFGLPGFSKDEVQINFQNGKLTVSAETTSTKSEHNANTGYTFEESHAKLSRTLQLPQGVKAEEIKATMENGLLSVTFPKISPEFAPKKIAIQGAEKKD